MGDEKGWITGDGLVNLGIGFIVITLFLRAFNPALLGPILFIAGGLSVFLMLTGAYRYLTQQDAFTVGAGFALAFLITLFFGIQYVINPVLLFLNMLAKVI